MAPRARRQLDFTEKSFCPWMRKAGAIGRDGHRHDVHYRKSAIASQLVVHATHCVGTPCSCFAQPWLPCIAVPKVSVLAVSPAVLIWTTSVKKRRQTQKAHLCGDDCRSVRTSAPCMSCMRVCARWAADRAIWQSMSMFANIQEGCASQLGSGWLSRASNGVDRLGSPQWEAQRRSSAACAPRINGPWAGIRTGPCAGLARLPRGRATSGCAMFRVRPLWLPVPVLPPPSEVLSHCHGFRQRL